MSRKLLELPGGLVAFGSVTAPGTVCTLTPASLNSALTNYVNPSSYVGVDGFLILLDATAVGTAAISVNVNLLNFGTGTYVTPSPLWGPAAAGVTNPVSVTNATAQVVYVLSHWPSVQVSITTFGTSTGTFRAMIQAF